MMGGVRFDDHNSETTAYLLRSRPEIKPVPWYSQAASTTFPFFSLPPISKPPPGIPRIPHPVCVPPTWHRLFQNVPLIWSAELQCGPAGSTTTTSPSPAPLPRPTVLAPCESRVPNTNVEFRSPTLPHHPDPLSSSPSLRLCSPPPLPAPTPAPVMSRSSHFMIGPSGCPHRAQRLAFTSTKAHLLPPTQDRTTFSSSFHSPFPSCSPSCQPSQPRPYNLQHATPPRRLPVVT